MPKAVITVHGDFIEMVWNDYALFFDKNRIRISEVRSVNLMKNGTKVQITFASHNSEFFEYQWFDTVNGNAVTSNAELYDEFVAIVSPQV